MKTDTPTRNRRPTEQIIADLEAKIATLKHRAAQQKVKRDPALKHVSAAVKAIDKAMAETEDKTTRAALDEARGALSACLSLNGGALIPSHGSAPKRITRTGGSVDGDALLTYVMNNPGQRGEQIAAALGTDSTAMRPMMKRLIAERKVKTRGQRRGMTYLAL
jgi:hypothetical protein